MNKTIFCETCLSTNLDIDEECGSEGSEGSIYYCTCMDCGESFTVFEGEV